MFGHQPDKFPLFQMEPTPHGRRVIIGPCAVKLIVGVTTSVLIVVTLVFYGPTMGEKLVMLLRAAGL
jgi:hypothetical protein